MLSAPVLRTAIRGTLITGVAAGFLTTSALAALWTPGRKLTARRARIASFFARLTLRVLNVSYDAPAVETGAPARMIVCNHLSYLDPLILSARQPTGFVTSVEVSEHWFLGAICRMAGCLFVERRNRSRIGEEIASLQAVFAGGVSVTVFPEATSGNGEGVLPFKSALFESAVRTGRDILPLCIRYTEPSDLDRVCYYGEMTFFRHFFRLLSVERIRAQIRCLDRIPVAPSTERKALSMEAQRRITEAYARLSFTT